MGRFRKKPVVIEAVQWFPGMEVDGVLPGVDGEYGPSIRTLEGRMFVNPGDWVITGVAGEKYPCKDAIFKATYEPVESGKAT